MEDKDYEKIYPHKKGDLLKIKNWVKENSKNEWKISVYLLGGYTLINIHTGEVIKALTEDVEFAEIDLSKIPDHEGHDVTVSYVKHPKEDRYLYCRTCKQEVKTAYKNIPMPKEVFGYVH